VFAFILVGSLFAWVAFKNKGLDRESKAAAETMIQSLCGSWDVSAFHKYGSAEFLKAAPDDRLMALTTWFSKNLGPLKSHTDLKGESKIFFSMNKMEASISAQYTCEAIFEKDKATLVLALSRPGETWQMVKFDIQSDALIRDMKDSSPKTNTKP
jgi:hypothetical protein